MVADLVGSTALSLRLDAEEMLSVIGACRKSSTKVIEREDGFVVVPRFMRSGARR